MQTHAAPDLRRAALARLLSVLGALALALALMPAVATAQDDDEHVTPARIDGQTRFHTAANIATTSFEEAGVAVLATGQDYPDALAASYAAGHLEEANAGFGPILLTGQDAVPGPTWSALDELGVQMVVLIGGPSAISAGVESSLEDEGYETSRVSGADRFATAAAVATAYGANGEVGTLDGDRTAILASGENFPDALSAGPLAARANLPLLLTPTGTAHDAVTDALEELEIERVVVVGGPSAVSSAVVQFYDDRGYEMERWDGRNRTETAVTVAQNLIQRFDFDASGILLARGDDYPDALAASVHGAMIGGPILLAATPQVLSPATEGHLFDLCPAVEFVRAIGGQSAISESVLNEAVLAAEQCHDDERPETMGFWSELADAPIERINHSAVWDGNELLVWGGGEAADDDGAAYHAATDTWRPIPAAPIDGRWVHEAVWADEIDRMIVFGGSEGADHLADCFDDGALYDPTGDDWDAIPPNPHSDAGCGIAMVWTGDELIVWGGHAGGGGAPEPVNAGATWSPGDGWEPIAASPLGARSGAEAVWTGDHMVVFGGSDAAFDYHNDAAMYDPEADDWTELPDAPITPRANPASTFTGAEVVIVGGSINGDAQSDGAALDVVSLDWRETPEMPGTHSEPVADMGHGHVLVVGGERDGQQPGAIAWDPTAHEWAHLADLPGEHRTNHTVSWAGDRLLVFGGQDADGTAGAHAWHPDD